MEYELKQLLNDTVLYKRFLSQSGTGSKSFHYPVSIKCYIEDRIEMVRDANGEEVISKTKLYMNGDAVTEQITTKDYFVFDGKDTPIINRSKYNDDKGNLYVVVVYL